MRAIWVAAVILISPASALPARVEILRSTGGVPAHIAGTFRQPMAFQETDAGQRFVFDRRAHAVYTIDGDAAKKIIQSEGDNAKQEVHNQLDELQKFAASGSTLTGLLDKARPSVWFVNTLDQAGGPSVGTPSRVVTTAAHADSAKVAATKTTTPRKRICPPANPRPDCSPGSA